MEGYTILARPDLELRWNGAGGWALYRRRSNGDLEFIWDFHEQCDTPTEAESFARGYLSAFGN
jgi:hypothetical protein